MTYTIGNMDASYALRGACDHGNDYADCAECERAGRANQNQCCVRLATQDPAAVDRALGVLEGLGVLVADWYCYLNGTLVEIEAPPDVLRQVIGLGYQIQP
jgi:hypothetical protein